MRQRPNRLVTRLTPLLFLVLMLIAALPVAADCPGNRLANPGFEDGAYQSSLSSWMSNGWTPWSLNEGAQWNREPEYKLMDLAGMAAGGAAAEGDYRVLAGNFSQAFFTDSGTHTSGFYQVVEVPRGSKVTFSIWVQIDTGQDALGVNDHSLADLDNPGNYRVYAGIDPLGNEPAGYGGIHPNTVTWSPPVLDRETRRKDDRGKPYDAWVQLTVSEVAQSGRITVYTKGQPEFPTKKNISFWDEACLIVEAPPTPTPVPATATPIVTETPVPTETPEPTETPLPTETPVPTDTPEPTATNVPATATAVPPTDTPAPTNTIEATEPAATAQPPASEPTAPAQPKPAPPASGGEDGFLFLYAGIVVLAIFALLWFRIAKSN